MATPPNPKLITVFGGAGFIGRHVVRALAKRGYRIRVACRRPHLTHHLQPLGAVGQIMAVQANLRYHDSIERAVHGSDHVINLVGLLYETGSNGFEAVQNVGARAVAEAARAEGVPLTHVSAIGADPESPSDYARAKGLAERGITSTLPGALIVRPSIVFGPDDDFFNKFANMARYTPVLPLIGGGETKFQPVYVGDVAEAVARHVDGTVPGGRILELGGPQVLTFRECLEEMLKVVQRKRRFVSIPRGLARPLGRVLAHVPLIKPPLTGDQVTQLQRDNIVSEEARRDGRTLEGIGISPTLLEAILPTYLQRFREHGQFTRPNFINDPGAHKP